MAAVVFPSPSPSPFPFPFPSPIMLLCRCSVFLSEFVASLRHLFYEQLFACHWISPSPCSPSLPPSPLPCYCSSPDIRYDKRSTPNPPTDYSKQPEASQSPALLCSALHCALCQSKPCINYTKRRLSRPATPPASHLPHARLVHCCSRIELDQSMLSWGAKLIRLSLSLASHKSG